MDAAGVDLKLENERPFFRLPSYPLKNPDKVFDFISSVAKVSPKVLGLTPDAAKKLIETLTIAGACNAAIYAIKDAADLMERTARLCKTVYEGSLFSGQNLTSGSEMMQSLGYLVSNALSATAVLVAIGVMNAVKPIFKRIGAAFSCVH